MYTDMTEGSPAKKLVAFSLPMIAGNIFQQCYNIADTVVVGRFAGTGALAAVGSSFAVITFITSVIIGLCTGSGILAGRFFGSRDTAGFRKTVSGSFLFIGGVSIVLTVLSLAAVPLFLSFFNIPPEIQQDAHVYLTVLFAAIPFTFLYNFAAAFLRAVGNSRVPFISLAVACVLNVGLDLLFVIPFGMGVFGAAIATAIAQGVSALICIIYIIAREPLIRYAKPMPLPDRQTLGLTVKYSLLTCIQQSIMNFGILLVQGLVNSFGTAAIAAFAAGVKIDAFAYAPVQDFGNAFSIYTAQNTGAGKTDRVREGTRAAVLIITAFCLAASLFIVLAAPFLIGLFVPKSETGVIELGAQYLRVEGFFYVLIGYLFMFYGYFRGRGQQTVSIILTVLSLGTRVALAYVLAAGPAGLSGVWWSIPIGWALADIAGLAVYRRQSLRDTRTSK